MFDIVCFSLGNFLCFTILAGIKDQKDPADKLHHGGWMAQIFCWIIIIFLLFSVPNIVLASSVKTFLAIVFFLTMFIFFILPEQTHFITWVQHGCQFDDKRNNEEVMAI